MPILVEIAATMVVGLCRFHYTAESYLGLLWYVLAAQGGLAPLYWILAHFRCSTEAVTRFASRKICNISAMISTI